MPKAVINLWEHANRVVNVIKAREGLKGKSEAIERIVEEFEEHVLDVALRPSFVEEVERVRKGSFRKVKSLGELVK